MLSRYIYYTNEYGLPGVRVRMWHPAIFIPRFRIKIEYLLGTYKRYKSQQKTLTEINKIFSEPWDVQNKLSEIEALVQMVDCGYECEWVKPYGFVPEAGCPIHEAAKYGIWYRCPAYDIVDDEPGWVLDDNNEPELYNSFDEAKQAIDLMNHPLRYEWYEVREWLNVNNAQQNKSV